MRVDRIQSLSVTPSALHGEGLSELPEGRWQLSLSDGPTTRTVMVEKRARAMALKLGDRWYGVRSDGSFSFFQRDADVIGGTATLVQGSIDYSEGRLRVELSDGDEAVVASGSIAVEGVRTTTEDATQRVMLKGTAHYFFLDGPTQTPLRIPVELVQGKGTETSVILPPTLTTNRGRLRIPLQPDGSLSYQAREGTSFKVEGTFDGKKLAIIIETSGTIGWTRKELTGAC